MKSFSLAILMTLATSSVALAVQSPLSYTPRASVSIAHAFSNPEVRHYPTARNFASLFQNRETRLCRGPSYFGSDKRRVIEVVYYTTDKACGLPPFYGFNFGTNSK